jgi:hypothetical protein
MAEPKGVWHTSRNARAAWVPDFGGSMFLSVVMSTWHAVSAVDQSSHGADPGKGRPRGVEM